MGNKAFEFDKFPRGKLPTRLTRRQFFQGLIHEIHYYSRQEDNLIYRLCDLGEAPDLDIALIIPQQVHGSKIYQNKNYVWGIISETDKAIRLFPSDLPALFVVQQFNGERKIVDASRKLAIKLSWDKQHSFAYVRGVFLWLVLAKIFIPKEKM